MGFANQIVITRDCAGLIIDAAPLDSNDWYSRYALENAAKRLRPGDSMEIIARHPINDEEVEQIAKEAAERKAAAIKAEEEKLAKLEAEAAIEQDNESEVQL